VSISRGKTETLKWVVAEESNPDNVEVNKENCWIKQLQPVMHDTQPGTFFAQLFFALCMR
jgi:hypothetical protein